MFACVIFFFKQNNVDLTTNVSNFVYPDNFIDHLKEPILA